MSKQSFADLGVSRAVVGSLAQHGITEPFAIQRDVIGDVLAGRDVLAKSPTGSGKTLAFGIPLVERIEADGPRPVRARARADARARDADRRGHPRDRACARAPRDSRLRRRRPASSRHGRRPLAHPRRDPRSPRGPARARRLHARRDPDARPRRGRPDARHGLSPGGRPDRRAVPGDAPDAVLLGDARRRGRAASRGDTRATPSCTSTDQPNGRASADVEHRFVAVAHEHRVAGARRRAACASAS